MARQPNTFITYVDAAYMIQYEGFIERNSFNENSKKLLTRADIENVFANVDKSSFSSYAFKRFVPYKLISPKKGKWRGINPVCEIETVNAFWRGVNPVCELESVPTFWRGINPACEVENVPTFWRGINPVCEVEEYENPTDPPATESKWEGSLSRSGGVYFIWNSFSSGSVIRVELLPTAEYEIFTSWVNNYGSIVSKPGWVNVSFIKTGETTLEFTVNSDNQGGSYRNANLEVTSNGITKTINITQPYEINKGGGNNRR